MAKVKNIIKICGAFAFIVGLTICLLIAGAIAKLTGHDLEREM